MKFNPLHVYIPNFSQKSLMDPAEYKDIKSMIEPVLSKTENCTFLLGSN